MKQPESLQEAIVYFSGPERAFRYAVQLRWPDARSILPTLRLRKALVCEDATAVVLLRLQEAVHS